MMNLKRRQSRDFRIDISALVDVLFTLLIFFSLTSTFVQDSGIEVELPKASSSNIISSTDRIEIYLEQSGAIRVDAEEATLDELSDTLTKIDMSDRMKYLVIVKADTNVRHGKVTEVLDIIKSHRFSNIAIATRPQQ